MTSGSAPHISLAVLEDLSQVKDLQKVLRQCLPYSIPLYRRIQFHLAKPTSPHAQILVLAASSEPIHLIPANLASTLTIPSTQSSGTDQPWLACHVDLSNPGQTAVWLFASWEIPIPPSDPITTSTSASTTNTIKPSTEPSSASASTTTTVGPSTQPSSPSPLQTALFNTLLTHLHSQSQHLPSSAPQTWLTLRDTGKILSQPYSRSKVIFGTIHETLLPLFPTDCVSRTDANYLKYVFAPPTPPPDGPGTAELDVEPPQGMRFDELRREHLQTVLDRSVIPRTLETLGQLVSVGLFVVGEDDPDPVAWGFLGKDASLSSLHTEPAYRGRGLARVVAWELLRQMRHDSCFASDGGGGSGTRSSGNEGSANGSSGSHANGHEEREDVEGRSGARAEESGSASAWGHSDVSESNAASRRVMERLGGSVGWKVAWVEVDVAKATNPCKAPEEK